MRVPGGRDPRGKDDLRWSAGTAPSGRAGPDFAADERVTPFPFRGLIPCGDPWIGPMVKTFQDLSFECTSSERETEQPEERTREGVVS